MNDANQPSSPLHLSPPEMIQWLTTQWRRCISQGGIYRFPQLATLEQYAPVRTVVLRDFHPSPLALHIHTDIRSAKVRHLRANPIATFHWYDEAARLQTIARAIISLHHRTELARTAWESLPAEGKHQYSQTDEPGTEIPGPSARFAAEPGSGWQHFCLLVATITEFDMLHLRQEGNIRCRLVPVETGWNKKWLAP